MQIYRTLISCYTTNSPGFIICSELITVHTYHCAGVYNWTGEGSEEGGGHSEGEDIAESSLLKMALTYPKSMHEFGLSLSIYHLM